MGTKLSQARHLFFPRLPFKKVGGISFLTAAAFLSLLEDYVDFRLEVGVYFGVTFLIGFGIDFLPAFEAGFFVSFLAFAI